MPESSVKERYKLYLQSDHWLKLRQAAIDKYGYKCEMCGKKTGFIQVHHIQYRHLTDVGLSDLIILCKGCHKIVHNNIKRGNKPETRMDVFCLANNVNERLKDIEKKIAIEARLDFKKRLQNQRKINEQLNCERHQRLAIERAKTLQRPKVRKKGRHAVRIIPAGDSGSAPPLAVVQGSP